jgi:hypothetical protein
MVQPTVPTRKEAEIKNPAIQEPIRVRFWSSLSLKMARLSPTHHSQSKNKAYSTNETQSRAITVGEDHDLLVPPH